MSIVLINSGITKNNVKNIIPKNISNDNIIPIALINPKINSIKKRNRVL